MSVPLHLKYRPQRFEDVVGQSAIVKSLQRVVGENSHHALLLTGPSGTGKTTLARIAMTGFGCEQFNLLEVNAAVHTGIDAMRTITDGLHYAPMGNSKARGVIVDEAHALSKAAWQSLLKFVEEPPKHVYWAFCTTEPAKVPVTIRNRCASYELRPVGMDVLFKLLRSVTKAEKFTATDEVLDLISERAEGSPRQALVFLGQLSDCDDTAEAAKIVRSVQEGSEPVLELCRTLNRGERDWGRLMKLTRELSEENPEGVRIQVAYYFTRVILDAKSRDDAGRAMEILDAFSEPYPLTTSCYPLLLSLGRIALQ